MRAASLVCFLALLTAHPSSAQHRMPPRPPFHKHPPRRAARQPYKPLGRPNVLTLNIPTSLFTAGTVGIAGGIEFERFLDRRGKFSVALPLYFYTAGSFSLFEKMDGGDYIKMNGGFLTPAATFHPFGNRRRADFGFGPALLLGRINRIDEQEFINSPAPYTRTIRKYSSPLNGFLATFNLTAHGNRGFVFATHLDVGAVFDNDQTQAGIVQFGFKFGGRF